MNPKERAEIMISRFGKEGAAMATDLVIKELNYIPKYATCDKFENKKEYWNEVKIELIKL